MEDLRAKTIMFSGDGSTEIQGYAITPEGEGRAASRGGVVVIHHLPGYDRGQKEIARHVAELGYDTVMPNLYWREGGPGVAPDDAAAAARGKGGIPDERLVGDVAGAAAYLRSLPTSNGKVGVIGFCSGGRHSVLAACNVDLDAAVDCYGAYVVGEPPDSFPTKGKGLEAQLPNLRAPLLGLFGNDDQYPSPEQVDTLEQILRDNDKTYEFHRYDDAAHAFFSPERPSYRVHAANDGWERIAAFYGKYLAG
jgi:carboxymethylenebutenolidase